MALGNAQLSTSPAHTNEVPRASSFSLDLPGSAHSGSASPLWRVGWRRYGRRSSTSALLEDVHQAKKPRLDGAVQPDWLRGSEEDAIDREYARVQASSSVDTHLAMVRVWEADGALEHELWVFELGSKRVSVAELAEKSSGDFDFETLFPAVGSSARVFARDAPAETVLAYDMFISAARDYVLSLLSRQTDRRFRSRRCGEGLIVQPGAESARAAWFYRPTLSLCMSGLVVQLKKSSRRLRLFEVDPPEGTGVWLAPIGLKSAFVRSVAGKGKKVISRVRLSLSETGEEEDVWWPAADCYVEVSPDDIPTKSAVVATVARDWSSVGQSLEKKQLSTAAYIEAVAKDRERERRDKQMALAKQQFGASMGTPSSAANTPVPPTDDNVAASTPASMPPQTPLPWAETGKTSVISSPVQTRAVLSMREEAIAPTSPGIDTMDWNPWPGHLPHMEDVMGGGRAFDLGLNDVDFSFFDDLPDPSLNALGTRAHDPAVEGIVPGSSPTGAGVLSPPVPYDLLNASSTSAESPSGRTPRTPFTPFTCAIDTEQTDPAMPSPAAPYAHFPLIADTGFGPIDFDDEDAFLPPVSIYCAKHGRSQTAYSPPSPRKSGALHSSLLWRSTHLTRSGQIGCPCGLSRSLDRRGKPNPPQSTGADNGGLARPSSDDDEADESDGGGGGGGGGGSGKTNNDNDDRDRQVQRLPPLGPSLSRLGMDAVIRLNRPFPQLKAIAEPIKRGPERIRFEFFVGSLADCVLHSMLDEYPMVDDDKSVLPTSVEGLIKAAPVKLESIASPRMRLCRRDALLDLDVEAMRYWQKLDLTPYSGAKPALVYVLDMGPTAADSVTLLRCIQQIGHQYEFSGFGKHTVGSVSFGTDSGGILRWPTVPWPSDGSSTRQTLREIGKRVMLSGGEARATVVLYIVARSREESRSKQICDIHRDMFGQTGHGAPSCVILPGSSVAELDRLFAAPVSGNAAEAWPFRLALSAYERIRITTTRMRLHPEGMVGQKWLRMFNPCFAPAFTLARSPSIPQFTFEWPARQLELLERGRQLFVAYTVSDDWEWVAMATEDDCGEDRNIRTMWIGLGKVPDAERFEKLARFVSWRLVVEIAPSSKIEWSVVLMRVGTCTPLEFHIVRDQLRAALAKSRSRMEVTLAVLRPLADAPSQELPPNYSRDSQSGDLCLLRNSLGAVDDARFLPTFSATVAAFVGSSSIQPLFDVELLDRASTAGYQSEAVGAKLEDRILHSLVHVTVAWRLRGPARHARRLPWCADLLQVFCSETAPYVSSAPPGTFSSAAQSTNPTVRT